MHDMSTPTRFWLNVMAQTFTQKAKKVNLGLLRLKPDVYGARKAAVTQTP